jgi:hypothetical protein
MQLIEIARTRPMAVPAAGVEETQADPVEVNTLPEVPGDVNPVPPLAAGKVPVTAVVNEIFDSVLELPLIVLFVTVFVLVSVSTLVGVMIPDSVAMLYS